MAKADRKMKSSCMTIWMSDATIQEEAAVTTLEGAQATVGMVMQESGENT